MTYEYKTIRRLFTAGGINVFVYDLCVPEFSDCSGAAAINSFFERLSEHSLQSAEKITANEEEKIQNMSPYEKFRYKPHIYKFQSECEVLGILVKITVKVKLSRGNELLRTFNTTVVWDTDSGLLSLKAMKHK